MLSIVKRKTYSSGIWSSLILIPSKTSVKCKADSKRIRKTSVAQPRTPPPGSTLFNRKRQCLVTERNTVFTPRAMRWDKHMALKATSLFQDIIQQLIQHLERGTERQGSQMSYGKPVKVDHSSRSNTLTEHLGAPGYSKATYHVINIPVGRGRDQDLHPKMNMTHHSKHQGTMDSAYVYPVPRPEANLKTSIQHLVLEKSATRLDWDSIDLQMMQNQYLTGRTSRPNSIRISYKG
ncbi:MAG: hypothetical protein J3Q66DRAFT_394586 [Benniella sp.]|nr:MAG: hypothetical protein J3Q66DRAFT_394586 [Benniella sp.]